MVRQFNFRLLTTVLILLFASVQTQPSAASAQTKKIIILHTNDLQSRFLGFGPNADYTPDTINDDATIGGVARLAALVESRRADIGTQHPILALDGGDLMMGSLFHTVSRETGSELQLYKMMSYDAVTLGNHDFDFRPDGLAKAIVAAKNSLGFPTILLSNIKYSDSSSGDDSLEKLAKQGLIKGSAMVEKHGVKFGLIGVMGWHAISVIGEAEPLSFTDPIAAVKKEVAVLEDMGADVFILLSHGGVYQENGQWKGDDIRIAESVPELDLIVSGHAHRITPQPVSVNKTLIVQAGSDGRFLGELTVGWQKSNGLKLIDYKLHTVNDQIKGSPRVQSLVDYAKKTVDEQVLKPLSLAVDMPVIESKRYLGRGYDEHALGNLAADALRVAAKADIAITSNGEIRDDIVPGEKGVQQVSDIFRIFPIGIGYKDDTPGYDLVKVYFTGNEIKNIMEILLLAYQVKGRAFFPRVSGVEVLFSSHRLPLDKVYQINLTHHKGIVKPVEFSADSSELYSVTMTHYAYKFLSIIDELSYGLLSAVPKNAKGEPLRYVAEAVVDADVNQEGVQKIKAWLAVLVYLKSFEDLNGNGIPDIESVTNIEQPRIIKNTSLDLGLLLKNNNHITYWFLIVVIGIVMLFAVIVFWLKRRIRG